MLKKKGRLEGRGHNLSSLLRDIALQQYSYLTYGKYIFVSRKYINSF